MKKKKMSPLLRRLNYFSPIEHHSNKHSQTTSEDRDWENVYRNRWQYDKVVRSTHGVNCTGSCSWNIYVKNGIVTWEGQNLNYPSTGPDMPDFEPRGCPRGASFSWYIYSPLRVKYPYVRGVLINLWREALQTHQNPLDAWKSIVENPEKAKSYKQARGKGGFVRAEWPEVLKLISASLLYTVMKYGPDRNVGFSPIPAMSMISHASGSRFMSLIGGPMLSFYDWYADLPPASPQIWGDQTDVPESSDWYNSGYIITWGSNVPLTRTPDAHFLAEARYKGAKVISISPDFAESSKFADDWLSIRQGTDGALAMAMGHVILQEFYVNQETERFMEYAKQYTDFPFLVTLSKENGVYTAGRFLHAKDIGRQTKHDQWKPAVWNEQTGAFAIPQGTMGSRWDGQQKWNLHMIDEDTGEQIEPRLSVLGIEDEISTVRIPYFSNDGNKVLERNLPIKKLELNGEEVCVTTVFDLILANYGVNRGIGGQSAASYDDPRPFTPAWQEQITGIKREAVIQIAREFAQNAIDTDGRSMIIVGAGINHWFNSDTIYRAVLNLVLLVGAQGVNGGGWAHYVGQEKLRPAEGWQTIATAKDWEGVPKLQNGTSFFYFATDQWRYEDQPISDLASPIASSSRYKHHADYNVLAARLGWLPSYPTFNQNGIDLYKEAEKAGAATSEDVGAYVASWLQEKKLKFAIEDPDNEVNFPRNLFVWRANLISSSGKGHEYFLKHLLGTTNGLMNDDSDSIRPEEIKWREQAPEGKLDLLINLDFRMAGTALYSDIVLPAATWYEKHDLSSTDMHPFIHPFAPAISAPWESRSDWDIFKALSKAVSDLAEEVDMEPVKEVVATPLLHDTMQELAQPFGKINDWSKGECEAIPGKTMPNIQVVERDYKHIFHKMTALGPHTALKPSGTKGMSWSIANEYESLKKRLGETDSDGVAKGCPNISEAKQAAEAILTLSSTSNGKVAVKAWESLENITNLKLKDLAEEREEECFTFEQITAQPKTVITSPAFTGSEKGGRRYSPFTTNVEKLIPWRTLTGRQSYYVDHELMMEFGETMATFKPILQHRPFLSKRPDQEGKEIVLNYLTPHNKWSVHSMYFDSLPMLTLFRGGPTVWMNKDDAKDTDIKDNDWIECFNRNGVVVARAVLSHRIPKGMAFMHHAQDRHINVPGTKLTNNRGGTHNSPTRIHVKPTQMIGGYAQLSYGFNYYGPTGNQRDLNVVIRKLKEVDWLED
ncbi:nitrate reductase A subunit alpha [Bacillus velezensis M27]|uniref:nitrate reductase subunit alpha n=1 Tax=Bacillus amyloliquefaciens group TaxID=1938374 RepID=UPI000286794C|nr:MULTISPECIES: nitrate reductase subunit alpha [Bacillus amyloliquefaciens group]ASF56829.1 nitrate reductase subunit alpha [Bacillus velezensis]EKE48817.1 nitrate reductase A subunit alpha [Bacillus velezensis M27]MCT6864081.1 nitrate reductase subunit alpha [Bacillus velezensis]QHM87255.1 Respiratory nitrate reductase 1 alpha chain [Bacillus velezensis]QOX75275.1 nitrate reductase subunit alpha [Bacillus velezensis]